MKNPDRTIADINQAHKHYLNQCERLKNVSHLLDRDFMGRDPTSAELHDLSTRKGAKEAALHALCAFPCAGNLPLVQEKARLLTRVLDAGDTLRTKDVKALLKSVL